MNISIASYSFHGLISAGMMDVFGYLESVRYRYHLRGADIWNGLLGRDPEQYLQPEFLRKVKQAIDERGLVLANYHADGCHPWEDDPAKRDRHHELALRHLTAAEILGAKTVRIDAGGREKNWTSEQFDHIVKRYREYAKRAGDHGYRIGPENHWGAEMNADNLVRMSKAIDHPAYGVLLHMGRWEGDSAEAGDRKILPWVVHTHVDVRTVESRLEPALRLLIDNGYQGYFDVETGVGKNEYEEVGWMIGSVRRALAKVQSDSSSPPSRPVPGPTVPKQNPLIPPGVQ